MVNRQGTNLQHAEITPYVHKYLLKKPRTHDSQDTAGRAISLEDVNEEESARIDDPLVEKRALFPWPTRRFPCSEVC